MKHTNQLARSATVAIAAALALGSTPLLAQSADPTATTVVPDVASPAASQPVAITPPVIAPAPAAAPIAVSHPVVQQVQYPTQATAPAAEPSAAPATTHKTVTRTTTTTTKQSAPVAAAQPAPAPVAAPANDVTTAPSAAPVVVPAAPVAADQTAIASDLTQGTTTRTSPLLTLVVLGGLMILVLAILAMLYRAFARRNRIERAVEAPAPRRVSAPPRPVAAPIPEPTPMVTPEIAAVTATTPVRADRPVEPTLTEPTPIRRQNVSFGATGRSATPGALPSAGASVDLPARVPEDFDERSALLQRMIEAKPDKANPFRYRKSRA